MSQLESETGGPEVIVSQNTCLLQLWTETEISSQVKSKGTDPKIRKIKSEGPGELCLDWLEVMWAGRGGSPGCSVTVHNMPMLMWCEEKGEKH